MHVLVFGGGAIGSLIGGLLSRDHDVTIVTRTAHVEAINRNGLRITGLTTYVAHPMATTQVPDGDVDIAFVTTKAYDTDVAVDALRPFWRQSVFVTLQNGLGNAQRIAAKAERVAAGTTTHGVTLYAPGEIIHAGAGDTTLGPVKGVGADDVLRIADMLTSAGIRTVTVDDVARELWIKAVVNAAINPLTAILRVPNGELVEHDDLKAVLEKLAREGAVAAKAAGVDLDPGALAARAADVARRTADNRSSMLQDIERGRRTEIEAITGEILRAAQAKGLDLPYNRKAYALVRGVERSAKPAA